MEKAAREALVTLVNLLESPLESGGTLQEYADGSRLESSDETPDEKPIQEPGVRLSMALRILASLVTGKRFTPWRVFTRGPKAFRSDWVTPSQQAIITLLLQRHFAENSEVFKASANYASRQTQDPSATLGALSSACIHISDELNQLLRSA
jgi:hypothetical protein